MSAFLLDTNCISELVRSKPDRLTEWMETVDERLLYLSLLDLQTRFSGRIIPT